MTIGGVVVAKSWGENYGDDSESGSSVAESIKKVSEAHALSYQYSLADAPLRSRPTALRILGSATDDTVRCVLLSVCYQASQQCKDDPTIIAACMLQSFFEAAMVRSVRSQPIVAAPPPCCLAAGPTPKPQLAADMCCCAVLSVHVCLHVDSGNGGPYRCSGEPDPVRPDLRLFHGE